MSFERKARPKTDYSKQHSVAKQNSFTLPLPEREGHHYDLFTTQAKCPYWSMNMTIKVENGVIMACIYQLLCDIPMEKKQNECLKGKRFAGAKT